MLISNVLNVGSYPFSGSAAAEAGFTITAALGASLADIDALDAAPWSQRRAELQKSAGPPKAYMPRGNPGAVQGEDLDRIVAWAKAWRAARRAR